MGVDEKALGQRLQKARQRAGLTQQELCQKAGLSYSTLAKIERGAIRSPSVFTVASIAVATNTSVEKLLNIKELTASSAAKKTSKTGVKFVYFDLNNTLVRFYEKAFTKMAEQTARPVDSIEAAYWRYDNDVCSGQMGMADFNAAMAEKLGIADFDWAKYYLEAVEPMPEVAGLVDWAANHYEIGLLSGTMPGLIAGLAGQGKLPLNKFSQVIDSSVVKILKSSPDIYKLAQQKAGYQPSEILLVDDDKLALINADEQGWQISRFNPYDPQDSIARVREHLAF